MSDDDLRYIKEKHLADVLEDLMATLVREKPSDIMLATKAWCDRKTSGSTTLKKLAPTIEVENSLRPDAGVKQTNSIGPVAAAPAPVPAPTPAPAPVPVKVNPVPIAKEPLNAKQVTEEDDDDKKNYVPPSPKNRAAPQRTFSQINKERPNLNVKPKEKKEKTGGGDDDDMSSLIEN